MVMCGSCWCWEGQRRLFHWFICFMTNFFVPCCISCSCSISVSVAISHPLLSVSETLKVSVPLWLCIAVSEPSEAAVMIAYPAPSVLHLPVAVLWEPRWINTMMPEFWASEKTNSTFLKFHNQWCIVIKASTQIRGSAHYCTLLELIVTYDSDFSHYRRLKNTVYKCICKNVCVL